MSIRANDGVATIPGSQLPILFDFQRTLCATISRSVFFSWYTPEMRLAKSYTLGFKDFQKFSNPFFDGKEARKKEKFRAKNENFIAGRPKMALLVKLFLNPGVSGDTWELL